MYDPVKAGSVGSEEEAGAHKAPEKQGGETKDYSSGSVGFELSDLLYSYHMTELRALQVLSFLQGHRQRESHLVASNQIYYYCKSHHGSESIGHT